MTKAEVDRLGLNHLIGTSLTRAYMHGFFVDNRLWHKARALAEPFAYDTYRQQRVQQKMDQERKSRISIVKKLPKVTHTHCTADALCLACSWATAVFCVVPDLAVRPQLCFGLYLTLQLGHSCVFESIAGTQLGGYGRTVSAFL